ncbi:MAG TPA: protein kinase [Candidatus Saccharimonadales bacterium]|nr:protein kinase [Candidatus Saccharimonadales bacterium]
MAVTVRTPAHEAGAYGEMVAPPHFSDISRVYFAAGNPEPVAIKELADNTSDPIRDRFVREPKILEALGPPQVPRVIEDHTTEDRPYFVMSRDPGYNPLARPYSLDPVFVAQIIHSALGPIDRLHQLGLANRDIKPDHFLVAEEAPMTKWIDFGMAEEITDGSSDRKSVPGTRLYLSPEDLNGALPSVTGDIYSIGASMYELLAGQTAHERPIRPKLAADRRPPQYILDRLAVEDGLVDDVRTAQEEIQTDTKPDFKVCQQWVDEEIDMSVLEERLVPAGLIAVVETATARDPADRYPSATVMREGLSYLLHEHVLAA